MCIQVEFPFSTFHFALVKVSFSVNLSFFSYGSVSCSVVSDSFHAHRLQPTRLLCPWNSPGKNTGMGSHSLLQGIFPTQGSNPGLPHRRQILYQLSHKGSPKILEWIAYPFSRGSSQPRNQTTVSCIAGRLFTNQAIREYWLLLLSSFSRVRLYATP